MCSDDVLNVEGILTFGLALLEDEALGGEELLQGTCSSCESSATVLASVFFFIVGLVFLDPNRNGVLNVCSVLSSAVFADFFFGRDSTAPVSLLLDLKHA